MIRTACSWINDNRGALSLIKVTFKTFKHKQIASEIKGKMSTYIDVKKVPKMLHFVELTPSS